LTECYFPAVLSSAKIGTSSWRYYTDGVACRASDYYAGTGEAPGRWHGRGLEQLLPADIWSELAGTYVGTDVEGNWNALFRTTALFRRVATEVGDALGYAYPREADEGVSAYLEGVRQLPSRPAGQ